MAFCRNFKVLCHVFTKPTLTCFLFRFFMLNFAVLDTTMAKEINCNLFLYNDDYFLRFRMPNAPVEGRESRDGALETQGLLGNQEELAVVDEEERDELESMPARTEDDFPQFLRHSCLLEPGAPRRWQSQSSSCSQGSPESPINSVRIWLDS